MATRPADDFDGEKVLEDAVRSYWNSEISRGDETIPFDDLDPVRQSEVRRLLFKIAPHLIRSMKESMFHKVPAVVPDVIPEYFFEGDR